MVPLEANGQDEALTHIQQGREIDIMLIDTTLPEMENLGLVREISGAAPAERRLQAAVTAGIARRGYLRGLAGARSCKIAPVAPVAEKGTPRKQD
jgi:CheY-like chemotaxis protein